LAVAGFQTAQVSKQQYRSKGGGISAGGGMGGMGGGGFSAGMGGAGMGGGDVTHIHLDIDGEQIHEAIVNQNDKADQQGKPSFRQN
jgi:hypothetical protein